MRLSKYNPTTSASCKHVEPYLPDSTSRKVGGEICQVEKRSESFRSGEAPCQRHIPFAIAHVNSFGLPAFPVAMRAIELPFDRTMVVSIARCQVVLHEPYLESTDSRLRRVIACQQFKDLASGVS